jgi:hypothetical protein
MRVQKKDRTFAIKTLLLTLQHCKHCPLQSSPLYWRYTVPNVSSIVGMLPRTHCIYIYIYVCMFVIFEEWSRYLTESLDRVSNFSLFCRSGSNVCYKKATLQGSILKYLISGT